MARSPLKPFYSFAPIRDLDTLSEVLGVTRTKLEHLSRNADRMYRCVPQKKKDGSPRKTWDAYRELKRVHQLIKVRLLAKAQYPLYLQGGIRDRVNPRDYARNAGIHSGQACIINEDIADFFPSTTSEHVQDIWENFFRFPTEVARCLTSLCTRRGQLPQGAKPSSYLANLVFWRTEHELVRYLSQRGFKYSRLADDITVSSHRPLSNEQKSGIVRTVYAFVRRNGYTPKYKKHAIFVREQRMLVNNLVTNRRPALPREERKAIRSIVHGTETKLGAEGIGAIALSLPSVYGKVGKLKRFHKTEGAKLASRLKKVVARHEKE